MHPFSKVGEQSMDLELEAKIKEDYEIARGTSSRLRGGRARALRPRSS